MSLADDFDRSEQPRPDIAEHLAAIVASIDDAIAGTLASDIAEATCPDALLHASRAEIAEAHAVFGKTERLTRTGSWVLELRDTPTLVASAECYRLLGLNETLPVAIDTFLAVVHPDDRDALETAMRLALSERRSYEIEHRVVVRGGTIRWLHVWSEPEFDEAGVAVRILGVAQDVTERKRAEDDMAYAYRHDALTGLANRLLLGDRIEQARSHAAAQDRSVIVVALDLDDIALINNTHGRETGDAVLVAVAERLSVATNYDAAVARTGSDEFVIVGDNITDTSDADTFVDRVRDALLQPILTQGAELFIDARIGVTIDEPSTTSETLLCNADLALARAKQQRSGPNVTYFDPEMRTRTEDRFALIADLRQAVQRDEFELRYQPITAVVDDSILGVEALIRWRHPTRGLIAPVDFIPLAEDTGMIVTIGAWVLEHACAQLRSWTDVNPSAGDLTISVNVSVKQLRAPGIVDTVVRALTRSGIDAGLLTIEMTESVIIDDLDVIGDVLTKLRRLGVRIAVDDFGTGYSSLAYLKHLPIDTLKIDQSFVEGLGDDPCATAIVASALAVARALGLFVVAEGVETALQLESLRSMECDAAQGFYFSKPVTAADIGALVNPPPTAGASAVIIE